MTQLLVRAISRASIQSPNDSLDDAFCGVDKPRIYGMWYTKTSIEHAFPIGLTKPAADVVIA